ncbi:phage baseplate assembly protein [Roseomonas chloroacetimidivorans]|uniref:phage baseplate assembly protein n=1 Tax=Roseomonas chloroacetimidivorans TaxID=1766656 RepID=UPI003C78D4C6
MAEEQAPVEVPEVSVEAPAISPDPANGSTPRGDKGGDDVTLVIDGKAFGGWTAIRVSRGIERMPSDFDIALTELFPGQAERVAIASGSECVLKVGADVVITGYVDRHMLTIEPGSHTVRIQGRGKCAALVDCSAGVSAPDVFATSINAASAFRIASDLAKPFGITVAKLNEEAGNPIPAFNVILSETAFEIIDRIASYKKLLAYEDTAGNLVLAQAGTDKMSSGFELGVNIEAATALFSADQRFSHYYVVWLSTDQYREDRTAVGGPQGLLHGKTTDAGVSRFRPRIIVSDQTVDSVDIGQARAEWEMNRRIGRSQLVQITCDSWRDAAGRLWQPNFLAPVNAPALKLSNVNWLITDVTYRRDETGTHADLILMPKEAVEPPPSTLTTVDQEIYRSQPGRGGAQAQ